tara:strand:+ start:1539 stop:2324 length:786 start_codon:yes stop_codon:yes gene_type:complete
LLLTGLIGGILDASDSNSEDASAFAEVDKGDWEEVLFDSGDGDWREQWFLDGLTAKIENGLHFASGPQKGNHADHAVLWTKESFAGDVRLDFLYTRTDDAIRNVNIIYVQATGSGEGEHAEDIMEWRHLREEPWMKNYFRTMNAYHISFAAFGTKNTDPAEDYIRARRYMPNIDAGLGGTDLKPDHARTGLFRPGVEHQITVIKVGRDLHMRIMQDERAYYCHWRNPDLPEIEHDRIGFRHIYGRSARYQNVRVSVRSETN